MFFTSDGFKSANPNNSGGKPIEYSAAQKLIARGNRLPAHRSGVTKEALCEVSVFFAVPGQIAPQS